MVYKGSSFDAPVVAYLKKGKKVKISNRTYGPFYKVKVRSGLIGYISDIDVKVISGKVTSGKKKQGKKGKENKKDGEDSESRNTDDGSSYDSRKPIFATKYLGLTGGLISFKEEVLGQKVSANITVYGVKLSGPNLLFDGPFILDINLLGSFTPPSYYKTFSTSAEPEGLAIFFDTSLIFPMITGDGGGWMVYLGAGPAVIYTSFKINIGGTPLKLDDVKLGGNFMLGLSMRLGRFNIKIEPKYIVEKSSYISVMGALQYGF